MYTKEELSALIKRCQRSPIFFIENFCKVKHPKAGVIDFKLFKYQQRSILAFLKNRFVIYKKNRQSGISTLAGAFALWYAMFFNHKTILIVSKRDDDAIAFLKKNIKFVYEHLPVEIKQLYGNPYPAVYNEHTIEFPNGSIIRSLTSSPDTLRSYSSSLNIIDESGFIPCMDEMWAAGQQTLMHGGSVICVSTPNGQGNWYHATWEDARDSKNEFYPIELNWWDMDWRISYKDEFTGNNKVICPTFEIKKCKTKEDKEKWGEFYSPWLLEQYRALQQKGEAHKFRQEVLAEFIGTGNTVLSLETLNHIKTTVNNNYKTVGMVEHVHPETDDKIQLDFDNKLHIWHLPVRPALEVIEHGRIIRPSTPGHMYGIGVDISTGEDNDFSAVEIVDYTAMVQVAELYIKILPTTLALMVDYLAKYYNYAYIIPERTGLGSGVCQYLYHNLGYTNIYRMKNAAGKNTKKIGFSTAPAFKPLVNKALLDYLGPEGVTLQSQRLLDQLNIYIHLGNKRTGNVEGPGNHDDLSMALGFALIGLADNNKANGAALMPISSRSIEDQMNEPKELLEQQNIQNQLNCILPYSSSDFSGGAPDPNEEIRKFTNQLGGMPLKGRETLPSSPKKYTIRLP